MGDELGQREIGSNDTMAQHPVCDDGIHEIWVEPQVIQDGREYVQDGDDLIVEEWDYLTGIVSDQVAKESPIRGLIRGGAELEKVKVVMGWKIQHKTHERLRAKRGSGGNDDPRQRYLFPFGKESIRDAAELIRKKFYSEGPFCRMKHLGPERCFLCR